MRRMTLTLPVLDAAMRVVFLVVGSEKAQMLHEVLEEKHDPPYPAQLVQPRHRGLKMFLVDKAAAALLTTSIAEKPAPEVKPEASSRGKTGRRM
jgi:6-phosphogluconolactonase